MHSRRNARQPLPAANLYHFARLFLDLVREENFGDVKNEKFEGWLVTNRVQSEPIRVGGEHAVMNARFLVTVHVVV